MCGCGEKTSENEMLSAGNNNSAEDVNVQAMYRNDLESDGIIEPMTTNTLVKKLSMLRRGTTLDEIIEIFGKEPFVVKETNGDIFKYYIGDVTVTLWGTELFQAQVECDNSAFMVDLGVSKNATD